MADWTPAEIDTSLWLDASDAATITIESGQVWIWGDKSGNGHDMAEIFIARRPSLLAAELDGKDVVSFDGVDERLFNNATDITKNNDSMLIMSVWKSPVIEDANINATLLHVHYENQATYASRLRLNYTQWFPTRFQQLGHNETDGLSTLSPGSGETAERDQWAILSNSLDLAGDYNSIHKNGELRGDNSDQMATDAGWPNTAPYRVTLCSTYWQSLPNGPNLNGAYDIAEMILVPDDVSDATREKIEGYLAWKWGLEGELVSGHTYESGPPILAPDFDAIAAAPSPLQAEAVFAWTEVDALASDDSLLGRPNVKASSTSGLIKLPGILEAFPPPAVLSHFDFTVLLTGNEPGVYVMDLTTPGGEVRVPISSWHSRLVTDGDNSVQCYIQAAEEWVEDIAAATDFTIYRLVELSSGVYEHEMVTAELERAGFSEPPGRLSCSLSGRASGYLADPNPNPVYDRQLVGIRSITKGAGVRARSDIDFVLRPGQRAFAGATEILVDYITYYVNGNDSYMVVGSAG